MLTKVVAPLLTVFWLGVAHGAPAKIVFVNTGPADGIAWRLSRELQSLGPVDIQTDAANATGDLVIVVDAQFVRFRTRGTDGWSEQRLPRPTNATQILAIVERARLMITPVESLDVEPRRPWAGRFGGTVATGITSAGGGLSPSAVLSIAGQLVLREAIVVEISLSSPLHRGQADTTNIEGRVHSLYPAVAGYLMWRVRLARDVAVRIGGGAGLNIVISGAEIAPAAGLETRTVTSVTALLAGRVGLSWRPFRHLGFAMDFTAGGLVPNPIVRVDGVEQGRLGQPLLTGTLGLEFF